MDEYTVRAVLQEAHDILASGHHIKHTLATDYQGNKVDVNSEAAINFCEWGAVLAACYHHTQDKQEAEALADRANDVLNAANPSEQYAHYQAKRDSATFRYNDSILETEQVVQRFQNALDKFDALADDLIVSVPQIKGVTRQDVYLSED